MPVFQPEQHVGLQFIYHAVLKLHWQYLNSGSLHTMPYSSTQPSALCLESLAIEACRKLLVRKEFVTVNSMPPFYLFHACVLAAPKVHEHKILTNSAWYWTLAPLFCEKPQITISNRCCLSVCLSVCLSLDSLHATHQDFSVSRLLDQSA